MLGTPRRVVSQSVINVTVNVTSERIPTGWCTDQDHFICSNLSFALSTWSTYIITMKSPITEVVFKVYNNVSFMEDSSKQVQYQIPVGLSFRMLGL